MTIFGFNTDIKFGDTIYHVQSEERRHDSLLQTQVFVRGRCIGKHSSSYSYIKDGAAIADSATDESRAHELLKAQHRTIVEAVRAGRVEEVLSQTASSVTEHSSCAVPEQSSPATTELEPMSATPILDGNEGAVAVEAAASQSEAKQTLELKFLNSESIFKNRSVTFRFAVADAGAPAIGAKVVCRFQQSLEDGAGQSPIYSQALTSGDGHAEVSIAIDESAVRQASLLVQASYHGKLATRKFRLKGK